MKNLAIPFAFFMAICFVACSNEEPETTLIPTEEAQLFLEEYNKTFQQLYYASAEAEWAANTKIVVGDTTNAHAVKLANEAIAAFTGSEENIATAKRLLAHADEFDAITKKQLETVLSMAANNPATVPDLVKERIVAENAQNEMLFGFDFKIDGESVSTNDIDGILRDEVDLEARKVAWEASKEVGAPLKEGLNNLRRLRNSTVQALGYSDYFTYQVSDYGMTTEEMMALNKKLVSEIWPLYRELHTYMRYKLAAKYKQPVPEMLPAHWIPNRWAQDWTSEVVVEGYDLDAIIEEKGAEWCVEQAERFYVSLGLEALPESFYTKSSLYPLPEGAAYKKNNHASAWHMDLNNDVRSLMSVEPNAEWYETTHHEFGHIYYYLAYSNPEVPYLLRGGANRAFHEAIGSMLGLAAMQKPFLQNLELIGDVETDETQTLLKEAMNYIVLMPFGAGVMTEFEHDLYAKNLPENQFNARWWELAKKYQGIVPPTERGEEYCDAASKTHINNDAAQYYDYALSYVILFQFHNHIAKNILNQDPHATNYYGSKEVGTWLNNILKVGATRDWREIMREATGEEISAGAMLEYFNPLMEYLQNENKNREYTLPETI